jgi:hypothetical protein
MQGKSINPITTHVVVLTQSEEELTHWVGSVKSLKFHSKSQIENLHSNEFPAAV